VRKEVFLRRLVEREQWGEGGVGTCSSGELSPPPRGGSSGESARLLQLEKNCFTGALDGRVEKSRDAKGGKTRKKGHVASTRRLKEGRKKCDTRKKKAGSVRLGKPQR